VPAQEAKVKTEATAPEATEGDGPRAPQSREAPGREPQRERANGRVVRRRIAALTEALRAAEGDDAESCT